MAFIINCLNTVFNKIIIVPLKFYFLFCIDLDISERPMQPTAKKQRPSYICLCLTSTMVLLCVLLVVVLGGAVYLSHNKSAAMYVGQQWSEAQYPLLRIVRFLAIPVHRFFDLTSLQEWECLVNNPAYSPGMVLCYNYNILLCDFIT